MHTETLANLADKAVDAIDRLAGLGAIDWDLVPQDLIDTLREIGVDEDRLPTQKYRVRIDFTGTVEIIVEAHSEAEAIDIGNDAIDWYSVHNGVTDSLSGDVELYDYDIDVQTADADLL